MNRISGLYDDKDWYGLVSIDGRVLSPARSQKVWNHSPDGFAWGYGGSGHAQLALAILLAVGVPKKQAVELHQDFKRAFIQGLPRATFTLEVDVQAWVFKRPCIGSEGLPDRAAARESNPRPLSGSGRDLQ